MHDSFTELSRQNNYDSNCAKNVVLEANADPLVNEKNKVKFVSTKQISTSNQYCVQPKIGATSNSLIINNSTKLTGPQRSPTYTKLRQNILRKIRAKKENHIYGFSSKPCESRPQPPDNPECGQSWHTVSLAHNKLHTRNRINLPPNLASSTWNQSRSGVKSRQSQSLPNLTINSHQLKARSSFNAKKSQKTTNLSHTTLHKKEQKTCQTFNSPQSQKTTISHFSSIRNTSNLSLDTTLDGNEGVNGSEGTDINKLLSDIPVTRSHMLMQKYGCCHPRNFTKFK